MNQQCSERRCCFFYTAFQWFEMPTGISLALPDAPRLDIGAPRVVVGNSNMLSALPDVISVLPGLASVLPGLLLLLPDSSLCSVSNGSGPSLRVRVWVTTEPLPNWQSGLSTHPNSQFGYGLMQTSQPVWIGHVVSGSPSWSICRFI